MKHKANAVTTLFLFFTITRPYYPIIMGYYRIRAGYCLFLISLCLRKRHAKSSNENNDGNPTDKIAIMNSTFAKLSLFLVKKHYVIEKISYLCKQDTK